MPKSIDIANRTFKADKISYVGEIQFHCENNGYECKNRIDRKMSAIFKVIVDTRLIDCKYERYVKLNENDATQPKNYAKLDGFMLDAGFENRVQRILNEEFDVKFNAFKDACKIERQKLIDAMNQE